MHNCSNSVVFSYSVIEHNVTEVASVAYWSSAENETSKKVAHGVYLCEKFLYNLKNYVFFLPFVTYYLQIELTK